MTREEAINSAWRILKAAYPALPRRAHLAIEIADAQAARQRGYYRPDEDERLRQVYLRYLGARAALWTMIDDMRPHLKGEDLRVFGIAFAAASMLVRSAAFLLDLAKDQPVVWKKLDEAEPRYGLERNSFTRIYGSIGSPKRMLRYRMARRFYDIHREDIHESLRQGGLGDVIPWLELEEPFFDPRKRSLWGRIMSYRVHSLTRRSSSGFQKVMFHLFRLSGCAIADMKQPFVKLGNPAKRAHPGVQESVQCLLKPGDVFITRHDDAMSNLFLPGFWPHAALYLGDHDERKALGLPPIDDENIRVLEAKKDGVKYRLLAETLQVDAFVVIRPKISRDHLKEALSKAMTHSGKLYDFVFDFRQADRLVCTEVIYRAYHGVGPMNFDLNRRSGRLALSAEDLLQQGLDKDLFEVILCFGVGDGIIRFGKSAESRLRASLRKPA